MLVPSLGVLLAMLFVFIALFVGKKEKSFNAIGFKKQDSWTKTILIGALLGIGIQIFYIIVFDPLIEKITGTPIDLSNLDNMRGDFGRFVGWIVIGFGIGGFLEEITFRGYLITRLTKVLGEKPGQLVFIVLVTSVSFGIAHLYQDISGMISTGSFAIFFGIIFIKSNYNLWYPILAHGFANTASVLLIYLDWDIALNRLLF